MALTLYFSTGRVLVYGTATILIDRVAESCEEFTYDMAVNALRGMVEWMTLYDEFYEWKISVNIGERVVGFVIVKNRSVPDGQLAGDPVSLIGGVPTGSVGTA